MGQFERGLGQRLLRVYDLSATCVRLDMTTASREGQVSAQGLFQFGYSKDQRPDVPQLKVALATLDPLGLPLATAVVPGDRADDPLYVPLVLRVGSVALQRGLLFVGDCKMGALRTRATIVERHDRYLCPLAATQVPPDPWRRTWPRRGPAGRPSAWSASSRMARRSTWPTPTRAARNSQPWWTAGAPCSGPSAAC